jgi:vancomycin resistance protein YoaR
MNEKVEVKEEGRKKIKIALTTGSVALILILATVLGAFAAQKAAGDTVYRGVSIASVPVGGLSKVAAAEAVQSAFERLINDGLEVELFDEKVTIDLAPSGATDPDLVYPLLDVNVNALVDEAYGVGRSNNPVLNFFGPLVYSTIGKKEIKPAVTVSETRLSDAIRSAFPDAESPGTQTDFLIAADGENWNVTVTPAVQGSTIDLSSAFKKLSKDASDFRLSPLELDLTERSTIISVEEAETLKDEVVTALKNGPYALTFTEELTKQKRAFPVTIEDLKTWLMPGVDENGQPKLTVDTSFMGDLLAEIHTTLDVSPVDAVFTMEDGRVTAFAPSRTGLKADDDALVASLESAFATGVKEIAISVETTEPTITTAESNNYGITEALGTGYSSYKGSPANRRANIAHGAGKLNGLLVAPGETLSLLEKLRPFTVEDGYLPELVIKGDEIIPEIGGGLCQIGTTTFRAAMNSGLDIAERRNHSLVVSYYNDPSNNQPGTDATIYDPAPDLKIHNDTENYIILFTENRTATSELFFTFWGTNDGREGSYTPPKVLSWTGYGETVMKETDKLAPGVKNCQAAHPGATTTFTYNVKKADGETVSREFTSTYRSLPTICLVGRAAAAPPPSVEGASSEVILE